MTTLITLWALMATAFAKPQYQSINIYVDITEVHAPDGTKGTSIPLNLMISKEAQSTSVLEHRLHYLSGFPSWNGDISVWDWRNLQYMPTYKKCDYKNAVKCGVKNKHWTLRTIVSVGDKFSVFQTLLYDETGKIIDRQDTNHLLGVMRNIFMEGCRNEFAAKYIQSQQIDDRQMIVVFLDRAE